MEAIIGAGALLTALLGLILRLVIINGRQLTATENRLAVVQKAADKKEIDAESARKALIDSYEKRLQEERERADAADRAGDLERQLRIDAQVARSELAAEVAGLRQEVAALTRRVGEMQSQLAQANGGSHGQQS